MKWHRIGWLAAMCISCTGWAQSATDALENKSTAELLAFHVKDSDFREVEIAPWVREKVIQAFIPPEMIDQAATWGVDVVHGSGPDPYFPLMKDDANSGPPADVRDKVNAFVAKARSHDMRVLVGIFPGAPVEMVKAHPEWMVCYTSDVAATHARAGSNDFHDRILGLNTPYGDYLIECLAEIMQEFDVDGYSFDGNYHPAINFAPYEREQYEKETGHPFPANADLNDLAYRLYLIWADDKLENWYRKLHDRLRQVKHDAAVYTWTTNAGRYGHFLTNPRVMSTRMNRLFDCPIQEWWLDEVNLGSSVVAPFGAAYVRAVTGGRSGASQPYLMSRGNPYCTDNFPRHELVRRSLSAMANGSMVPLGGEADAIQELVRRTPWFVNTTPMPYAAMLVCEQSRQFYGYSDVMARFLSHCLGVFRAAYESHLPLNLINDWDITPETLKQYKVLILPNSACLSDEQAQTIRDWVAAGGGLVATCETSLFDEIGRPRKDFALADVFGVSYLGRPTSSTERAPIDANFAIVVNDEYWARRVGHAALRWSDGDTGSPAGPDDPRSWVDDPRMTDLAPAVQVTFKGPMVKIPRPTEPMKQIMIMFPDLGAETFPAAVAGNFGSGRVAYFAVGIDSANYSYGFPYMRILLERAVRWAAKDDPPIRVEAPMCVQSTFFQQNDEAGDRVIVHLFNDLNTTDGHGLPSEDVPLREETIPIHGIKVRFNAAMNFESFHLEPEGQVLTPKSDGDAQVIEVPPLAVHAMVVGEMR